MEAIGFAIAAVGLLIAVVGLLARRAERRFRIMCFVCVPLFFVVGALFVRMGFAMEGAGDGPLQARQWLKILASCLYILGVTFATLDRARRNRLLRGRRSVPFGWSVLCFVVGVILDIVALVITLSTPTDG